MDIRGQVHSPGTMTQAWRGEERRGARRRGLSELEIGRPLLDQRGNGFLALRRRDLNGERGIFLAHTIGYRYGSRRDQTLDLLQGAWWFRQYLVDQPLSLGQQRILGQPHD